MSFQYSLDFGEDQPQICTQKKKRKSPPPFSAAHREALSLSRKGKKKKPHSQETKDALSRANKGKKRIFTQAHRDALSKAQTGKKFPRARVEAQMRSRAGYVTSQKTKDAISQALKGKAKAPFTQAHKDAISRSKKGTRLSQEHKDKLSKAGKGRIPSKEAREALRQANLGAKCRWWKGGIYPEHRLIRHSAATKEWRKAVFDRDAYTCVMCHKKGGYLNADHIKPFSLYPELRFNLDNGRTLCVPCHRKTDTYGAKVRYYKKQEERNDG